MIPVYFFNEDVNYKLKNKRKIKIWVTEIAKFENCLISQLNVIFCSDYYLLKINQDFLNHNYFTDIITFNNSSTPNEIEGDLYISIDRVLDNSHKFANNVTEELLRVIAHGLLHLIGFDDKSEHDISIMRQKENYYLNQYVSRETM